MKTFLVGGAVRDKMMGLKPNDFDYVVVGSTPEVMLGLGFKQVGRDFPVFLSPVTGNEHALARTEFSTGAAHTDFELGFSPNVTLREDLIRRDLTINAMAEGVDGQLIDPYNGAHDVNFKFLRHVSMAFLDDPLRVLRVARFAARFPEFVVATETMKLMTAMVDDGMLDSLTPERVWKEMNKALECSAPWRFFEVLKKCGALKVILPEVDALDGVPQPAKHHPEVDTFVHTMMCLKQCVAKEHSTMVRFAVLVHDLGKGTTPKDEWPKHLAHEKRGVRLVNAVCDRLNVPNEFRKVALVVTEYHTKLHGIFAIKKGAKVVKLLERLNAFHDAWLLVAFMEACEADACGRLGFEDRPYPQRMRLWDSFLVARTVTAKGLLKEGFEPGPELAVHLRTARAAKVKKSWKMI